MPVLEPVVATLLANTSEFLASLEAAKVAMRDFSAEAAVAGTGVADAGAAGGAALAGGIGGGATAAEGELAKTETAATKVGKAAENSGGKVNILGSILGKLPGPLGTVNAKTNEFADGLERTGNQSSGMLSALTSIPTPALIAGAAVAAVGVVSIDMANKFQSSTNKIAAAEGITTDAASKIGSGFLTTAGTVTYSGKQIADAFAGVAGQAKEVNGKALTAKQSLDLMRDSMNLAEASGAPLAAATSAITKTLQSFSMGIDKSPLVSDVLYNAANKTGQKVPQLAMAFQRVKTAMGASAPSIQEIGGLMLDLTNHGVAGRGAIAALGSAFNGITNPSAKVTAEQQKLGVSFMTMDGHLRPIKDIIGQLQPKLAGLSPTMAANELKALGFGGAAKKLATTFQAGPEIFAKSMAAIQKHGSAETAAEKATSGMTAQFEKAKAGIEDGAIALGQKLMPAVTAVAKGLAAFIAFIAKEWPTISKVFNTVFNAVKPGLELFGKAIKDIFKFITEHKAIMIGVFGAIAVAVLLPIAPILLLAGAATLIMKNWSKIENFFVNLWHSIYDGLKPVLGLLRAGFDFIVTIVKVAFSVIQQVVKIAWDIISGIVKVALDIIIGVVKVFADLLSGHWGKAWDDIKNTFMQVGNAIKDAVVGVFNAIKDFIVQVFNDMKSGIVGVWNGIFSFFSGIFGAILGVFKDAGGWLVNVGSNILGGMLHGIQSAWGWVWGFFSGLGGMVLNAVGDAFQWLRDVGWNILMGLWHGIQNGVNWVISGIKNIGGGIINAFKSVFSIFSPSKVFHGMGENLMQGLANGIVGGASLAHKAIRDVGDGLTTNFALGVSAGMSAGAISPVSVNQGGGGTTVMNVTTPIQVNGQTIAQVVTQYQLRGARSTGTVLGQYSGGSQTGAATGINVNAISR